MEAGGPGVKWRDSAHSSAPTRMRRGAFVQPGMFVFGPNPTGPGSRVESVSSRRPIHSPLAVLMPILRARYISVRLPDKGDVAVLRRKSLADVDGLFRCFRPRCNDDDLQIGAGLGQDAVDASTSVWGRFYFAMMTNTQGMEDMSEFYA